MMSATVQIVKDAVHDVEYSNRHLFGVFLSEIFGRKLLSLAIFKDMTGITGKVE